jgi:polyphenol oxidase
VTAEFIVPEWRVPACALVTTRTLGDVKESAVRARLRAQLPADPCWLKQVHGVGVIDAARHENPIEADASFTRERNVVCVVMAADCMPVLLADERGEVVGAAHAGWRGLCAGVIEATVAAMSVPATRVLAWLGPAIGPNAYEIGVEVRDAYLARDPAAASAFVPTRAGHWNLDLCAVARQRLATLGITRVGGGDFCTLSDDRFYSYRRDKTPQRMAAAIWLA